MTLDELKARIREVADACDETDEQQAVKSVLYGLLGAMCARRQMALMDHCAVFSQNEIRRLTASRN